ncbi:MAG: hypothetical protein KY453_12015, partial [Gemmatimonadetes bacterium]|nr:hypothetical protein [Gemmatimonadota bacterium]
MRPSHLKRYKDVARLLLKYGDAADVRRAGLGPTFQELEEEAASDSGAAADERPEALADDLERLGPTFVKLGQVLASRPDLLPRPYLDALARLQDRVEPVPFEEIESLIEEEIGVRLSKAFSVFEETPLAAASLGQVHRAALRDGRVVAVKVQRPGIRTVVRRDMEALEEMARMADAHTEAGRRYSFSAMLREFRDALTAELDYHQEARNLETLAESLSDFERIVVPLPVHDYTTSRVLTMDFVRGRNLSKVSPLARLEMEGTALLDELFEAYLRQALVDGLLHADPHPGNVFLTDDGRLALLDVGMVLRIPDSMRERLLKLLLAIGEGDGEEVARVTERMGDATPAFDRGGFRNEIVRLVGRMEEATVEDGRMGRVVLAVARLGGDHGLRPPGELSLIGKTLINLDQIAGLLDPAFDPQEAIRRHAAELTTRRVLKSASPGNVLAAALEARDFAEALPGRVNRALDAIGENNMEVRVRVIDEMRMLDGLHHMANRITTGLVLAALIVGASLLMHVETTLTLFGYPVLAIVFFLAAALGLSDRVRAMLRADPGLFEARTGRGDYGEQPPSSYHIY